MSADMTSKDLAFGATSDQIDEIERLLRIISAHGDVVWAGSASELNEGSLPVLGETIYEAAEALCSIFDEIGGQTLKDAVTASAPVVARTDLPTFDSDVGDSLLQAFSVMQLMNIAAQQDGGLRDASGSCRLVTELIWNVHEYIADNFDPLPREGRHG